MAQQRLKSRIPLIHASFELQSGKARMTLLDSAFRGRSTEFRAVVEKSVRQWLMSGLRAVFDPKDVVLRAPPGYAYQKPSGARSELFLEPDLALKSSAVVAFVALALFNKLFSGRSGGFAELQTVFVDTMAIAPVAYGLRELLALCGFEQAFHIESFHSYGGFEEVRKPLQRTSLCLISASTSMALHEQWVTKKEVAVNEVVTILTLTSAKQFKDGALLAIDVPEPALASGSALVSIRIKGETFLPEQEPPKKVLLTDAYHRSDEDVEQFCAFAGQGVFDVYRRPARSGSRPRALFVDGMQLLKQTRFTDWLHRRLLQSAKAATRVVVFQDDPLSKALAQEVTRYCTESLGLPQIELVSSSRLSEKKFSERAGVIVCAAVVGKGSQMLEVSRALRDKHDGPRLYLIGYQVAETRGELMALELNLRHSKGVPYEIARFGKAAIGTQLGASFGSEVEAFYGSSLDPRELPGLMKRRAQILGSTSNIGELALLPHGEQVADSMRLRAGFAYWPKEFEPQPCHAEVLATIAVVLQRAREHDKLPEGRRLASQSFRHVVLDPENFSRFNDGVLQAALLRCASPAELDYRGDHAASDFMKAVILRALARATQEAGEGVLEFLLALSQRRLQLSEIHFAEVDAAARAQGVRPRKLQAAIDFVIQSPSASQLRRARMPF
ncbi:hypothetical protein ISF6_2139 [Piscinibacter sakaiensis]|uniref:Uncharacterized protein n=1 Tax=Piscinibacter sakaiensis TaxID=1547922 RepID=A0A0K8P185_PISS1|nr:hypothetical protein ISF6_2139 [Piscinibacter sakaiensis]